MSDTVTYSDVLTTIACGKCGIRFAVPEDWRAEKHASGGSFWCPNGHERVYRVSTEMKLRRELEQELIRSRAIADQRDAAERTARAYKGVATKVRNRVAKGVCPCCTRSFANLRDHMASQHPAYAAGESA